MAAVETLLIQFAERGARDVSRALRGIGLDLTSVLGSAASLSTLLTGALSAGFLKAVESMSELGGRAVVARDQFDNTAKTMGSMASNLLPQLRRATMGTVADMDLMRLANFANTAGLKATDKQMAQLAENAFKLGRVMGRDTVEAFERLTFGITKQERRILDELGIVVRAKDIFEDYGKTIGKAGHDLTAAEKQQAFFNTVLTESTAKTKEFKNVNFEAAAAGERIGAAMSNFVNTLAELFTRAGGVDAVLRVVQGHFDQIIKTISDPKEMKKFIDTIVTAVDLILTIGRTVLQLFSALAPLISGVMNAIVGILNNPLVGAAIKLIGAVASPLGGIVGQGRNVLSFGQASNLPEVNTQGRDVMQIMRNMQISPNIPPVTVG